MGFFSDDSDQAQNNAQIYGTDGLGDQNTGSWTHEAIAGAAAYEGAKAYENHCSANGQPGSHQEAKELMAGFAGAESDKLFETHGLDHLDQARARDSATNQAQDSLSPDNY